MMKKVLSLICIVFVLILACSGTTDPKGTDSHAYDWPDGDAAVAGLTTTDISQLNQAVRNLNYVDGFLIIHQGKMVWEYYANKYDANWAHHWHSGTKSIVGTLIGLAIDKGFIASSDKKIMDYLTEYRYTSMDARWEDITFDHLLDMKAGLPASFTSAESEENAFTAFLKTPLTGNPGDSFIYSGLSAHGLSLLISLQSQRIAASFARTYLCNPLDIKLPAWAGDQFGYSMGSTALEMTPRDMARIAYCYLQDGFVDGQQIISSTWTRRVTESDFGEGSLHSITDLSYKDLWWIGKLNGVRIFTALGYAGQLVMGIPSLDLLIVTTATVPQLESDAEEQVGELIELIGNRIIK
ncbi:serine hydrolase [bacterium]|nr:serine hydrolase [bacterium]